MSYSYFYQELNTDKLQLFSAWVADELQQFLLLYPENIVQMPINNIADKYIIAMSMTFPNKSQDIHRDRD